MTTLEESGRSFLLRSRPILRVFPSLDALWPGCKAALLIVRSFLSPICAVEKEWKPRPCEALFVLLHAPSEPAFYR